MNDDNRSLATRQDDGLAVVEDTAQAGAVAMAKAKVSAQYELALHRPRSLDQVRLDLLKECKRSSFAQVAKYVLPLGGSKIRGWSIRFAEAALAAFGNVVIGSEIVRENDKVRVVRVTVTDLERNLSYSHDCVVQKLLERRSLRKGQTPVAHRQNSQGQMVYLVQATDAEIMRTQNAEQSKAVRTLGLRLLPGWLLEQCAQEVDRTLQAEAAQDPDGARNQLVEAFAGIGVAPKELEAVLSHSLDACSPAEVVELRAVYQTVKDGETTWSEYAAMRGVETTGGDATERQSTLRSKIQGKIAKRKAKTKAKSDPGPKPQTADLEQQLQDSVDQPSPADDLDEETKRLIAQGYELDPNTGELVPPPGADG